MRKYYFEISSILFLIFGLSCTREENKSENQVASRPTAPIQNGEVRIGMQVWMTKNLNVSRYRNGDIIPQVTNPATLANISTGAWCYYQNSSVNGRTYGKLYNGWAVTDPRGLAPIGYHVPTDAEWFTLTQYLGGDDVAGGKMKTMTLWNAPNTGATNSSGFSALPGGYCSFNGYGGIGNLTRFWSSTDSSIGFMYHRGLFYFFNSVDRLGLSKNEANQVRCIKD